MTAQARKWSVQALNIKQMLPLMNLTITVLVVVNAFKTKTFLALNGLLHVLYK